MKAVVFEKFGETPSLRTVPDPRPTPEGVVVKVVATGLCRSDWHGWMGHDPDVRLPHVPGHELAGTVAATGRSVRRLPLRLAVAERAGDPKANRTDRMIAAIAAANARTLVTLNAADLRGLDDIVPIVDPTMA